MPGEHNGALRSRGPCPGHGLPHASASHAGSSLVSASTHAFGSRFHWWDPPAKWKVLQVCSPRSAGRAAWPVWVSGSRSVVGPVLCMHGRSWEEGPPDPAGCAAGHPLAQPEGRDASGDQALGTRGLAAARIAFPPGHLRWSHEVTCCLRN